MQALIAAAKAVIDATDAGDRWRAIVHLRTAVDRAERQEAAGFKDWWKEHSIEWGWTLTEIDAERFWTAAQLAERERCREIVITMGGPDVPELLRQIDSGEE